MEEAEGGTPGVRLNRFIGSSLYDLLGFLNNVSALTIQCCFPLSKKTNYYSLVLCTLFLLPSCMCTPTPSCVCVSVCLCVCVSVCLCCPCFRYTFGELAKVVSVRWKEMTVDDKAPFEEKAEADKARYIL